MIAVNRIEYSNLNSIDLDLIVDISFDGEGGETSAYLNREAVASESYRGEYKRVYCYKYNEVFSPKFTFIKKGFEDFTQEDVRHVLKWLTSKDTASFLTVYHDDSEVISYEILGAFTEIQTYKLGNGRVVGITAIFESIAPWAFSPLQIITKDVSNPSDNKITINLETDDVQSAVYPRFTIQQDSLTNIISIDHPMTDIDDWVEGSVYQYNNRYYWIDAQGVKHDSATNNSNIQTTSIFIRNTYTDEYGKVSAFDALVKNNIKGETVVLDGANKVVSSSSTRIFGDDFSWSWLPLYEGKNELSFVGNCTVTMEYRYPINCGEL